MPCCFINGKIALLGTQVMQSVIRVSVADPSRHVTSLSALLLYASFYSR